MKSITRLLVIGKMPALVSQGGRGQTPGYALYVASNPSTIAQHNRLRLLPGGRTIHPGQETSSFFTKRTTRLRPPSFAS